MEERQFKVPTSFAVGAKKILAGTEPRFVVLTGNEYGLRQALVRDFQHVRGHAAPVSGSDNGLLSLEVFLQSGVQSQGRSIRIHNPDGCSSWDWLPIWFNKVKNTRIIVDGAGTDTARNLEQRANTRGIVIDCNAPVSERPRNTLVKFLSSRYSQSPTQVNLLLNKNNWKVTECMQLLDKLALLNMALTSDTISKLGVAHSAPEEFIDALTANDTALALTVIPRLPSSDWAAVIERLSSWLDKLSRIKCAQGYMKSANDVAFEVGESKDTAEKLIKQGRRYDLNKINKIALALAAADRDLLNGYRNGVLEVLVSKW